MITRQQIKDIAQKELQKHSCSAKIEFLNKKKFKKKALYSPIISQSLEEGNTLDELNIPALISRQTNAVYISLETINHLLKDEPLSIQIRFIKSVILHEIFHLKERKEICTSDFNTALRLEENTTKKFKKHYPGLAALGKRICKSI